MDAAGKILIVAWVAAWPCKIVAASNSHRNSNMFRGQPPAGPSQISAMGPDASQLVQATMELPAQIAGLHLAENNDISALMAAHRGHKRFLSSLGWNTERHERPVSPGGFLQYNKKVTRPARPPRFRSVPSSADPTFRNPTKSAPDIMHSADVSMGMQLDIPFAGSSGISSISLGAPGIGNAIAQSMQNVLEGAQMQQQREQVVMHQSGFAPVASSQEESASEEFAEQQLLEKQFSSPESLSEDDELMFSGSLGPQRSSPVQRYDVSEQSIGERAIIYEDLEADAPREFDQMDDEVSMTEELQDELHDEQQYPTDEFEPIPIEIDPPEFVQEDHTEEQPRVSALSGLSHRTGGKAVVSDSEEDAINKRLDSFIVPMLWLLMLASAGVLVAMIVAQRLREKEEEKSKAQMAASVKKSEIQSIIMAATKVSNHGAMLIDRPGFKLVESLKVPAL